MPFSALVGHWQKCFSVYDNLAAKAALLTRNSWGLQYKPAGIYAISSARAGHRFALSAALHDLHKHRSLSTPPRTHMVQHEAPPQNAAPPASATANITTQPPPYHPKPPQQSSTTPRPPTPRPPTPSRSRTSSSLAQHPQTAPQAAPAAIPALSGAPPSPHTMTAGPATPACSPVTPNLPPRNAPPQPPQPAKQARKPTLAASDICSFAPPSLRQLTRALPLFHCPNTSSLCRRPPLVVCPGSVRCGQFIRNLLSMIRVWAALMLGPLVGWERRMRREVSSGLGGMSSGFG